MKRWIAPSILAADFADLSNELKKVEVEGADWIHVDVMDGHFVPNLTIGAPVVKSLKKKTNRFLDCHLMVTDPHLYFEDFVQAGADMITFHAEATVPLSRMEMTLNELKKYPVKRGIAISPDTSLDMVRPWLDQVDMILVMSVFPGFGGQKFLDRVLEKIKTLRGEVGDDFLIQVDGGITCETIGAVAQAGANIFVAGTAVFAQPDPAQEIQRLLEAASG